MSDGEFSARAASREAYLSSHVKFDQALVVKRNVKMLQSLKLQIWQGPLMTDNFL